MDGLVLVADEDVAALVCAGSGFPAVRVGDEPRGGAPTVGFSSACRTDVLWLSDGQQPGAEGRIIATSGDDLWRLAPWPAADELFEWTVPAGRILVVGERDAVPTVELLRSAGAEMECVKVLGPRELEAAAVVVFPGSVGDALPAEAPAVLAAGRILVTTPRSPSFGLRPGIDHCVGPGARDLADLALSAVHHPSAFRSMRVFGRLAAERHRASLVLADLATDLKLGL